MRERSLEEFESIFERASIPVLDIEPVRLARVSAVLEGDPLDASILSLASYLKERFGAEVLLHYSKQVDADEARAIANRHEFQPAEAPYDSEIELSGQITTAATELVLLGVPAGQEDRGVSLDPLVRETLPPILIVHRPVGEAETVFRRVLHSLTGNFQQTQNFAYSFALVAASGELVLLHTIDATELEDVRDSLQVSPEISQRGEAELLESLTHHGERYLKAVVTASRDLQCDVRYRLALGEVLPVIQQELARGPYGLLVIGRHQQGKSYVDADVYQLMHRVTDIPVLAL